MLNRRKKSKEALKNAPENTELTLAAREGDVEMMRKLLANGAPIDEQIKTGHTALILAIQRNHPLVVMELLICGAAIDISSRDGDALNLAVKSGNPEIFKVFQEHSMELELNDGRKQALGLFFTSTFNANYPKDLVALIDEYSSPTVIRKIK